MNRETNLMNKAQRQQCADKSVFLDKAVEELTTRLSLQASEGDESAQRGIAELEQVFAHLRRFRDHMAGRK